MKSLLARSLAELPSRHPPVWLLGLCNFTLGAYYAVMLQTVPQLLSADGVPQPAIAQVTAIGMVPSFCSFFVSPILDWRYTRRAYAIALALLTGGALLAMLALLHDMTRLATFMFIGAGAVTLYQAALGGWLASILAPEEKGRLGAWLTVANVAGGGVTAATAIVVLRQLPYAVGVAMLAALPARASSAFSLDSHAAGGSSIGDREFS